MEEARNSFEHSSSEIKSELGAESKYYVAEISFMLGEYEKAEKEVFEFIDQNSPHAYWMAKTFLLLADVSVKKNDIFQARHTLISLLDYYTVKDDGIIESAQEKLKMVEELEEDGMESDSTRHPAPGNK